MRFTFYAALFASASAVQLQNEEDAYADYLWAQYDAGEIPHEAVMQLAEEYAASHWFGQVEDDASPAEMAEMEAQPHANADGIIADAKWLGGKALGAAKAVGGAIDSAYDATKGAIKSGAKAIYNAPGNAIKAAKDWKKRHNFAQGGQTARNAVVKAK